MAATEAYEWSRANDMQINPSKTKEILIDFSSKKFNGINNITLHNNEIEQVGKARVLGVIISKDLKWNSHVDAITERQDRGFTCSHNSKEQEYLVRTY